MSAPFITTLVDASGLVVYFVFAPRGARAVNETPMPLRVAAVGGVTRSTSPTTTTSGACPIRDDRHLFELLCLEGAQAGLAWITILRKREGYRERVRRLRPRAHRRATPMPTAPTPGRCADRPQPRQDRRLHRQRPRARSSHRRTSPASSGPSSTAGRCRTRGASMDEVPAQHRRVGGACRRTSRTRLPVRRADDLLRLHAVGRARQRPPRRLLPPRQSGPVEAA